MEKQHKVRGPYPGGSYSSIESKMEREHPYPTQQLSAVIPSASTQPAKGDVYPQEVLNYVKIRDAQPVSDQVRHETLVMRAILATLRGPFNRDPLTGQFLSMYNEEEGG